MEGIVQVNGFLSVSGTVSSYKIAKKVKILRPVSLNFLELMALGSFLRITSFYPR